MVRISLEIPDELVQQLAQSGKNPTEFLQERLSATMNLIPPYWERFDYEGS
jgi:hypothetical protein